MNELCQILAIVIVIAHCAVIFWPRKPLDVPTDENGVPKIWRNEDGESSDVACVWGHAKDDISAVQTKGLQQRATPTTSVSNELTTAEAQKGRRVI